MSKQTQFQALVQRSIEEYRAALETMDVEQLRRTAEALEEGILQIEEEDRRNLEIMDAIWYRMAALRAENEDRSSVDDLLQDLRNHEAEIDRMIHAGQVDVDAFTDLDWEADLLVARIHELGGTELRT